MNRPEYNAQPRRAKVSDVALRNWQSPGFIERRFSKLRKTIDRRNFILRVDCRQSKMQVTSVEDLSCSRQFQNVAYAPRQRSRASQTSLCEPRRSADGCRTSGKRKIPHHRPMVVSPNPRSSGEVDD